MKQIALYLAVVCLLVTACQPKADKPNSTTCSTTQHDTTDRTNNFYDNEATHQLPTVSLVVDGEIESEVNVDYSSLPLRTVIVKEAKLNADGTNSFIGAYRYDGHSLFDIINSVVLKKKNSAEFPPIIDLYVEVSNAKGEKVVISWGELYYPNNLHNIIIANAVMRIVPSKTKELWPLPDSSKLIIANDLLTERNITNPNKITIRSLNASLEIRKGLSPMYSESFIMQQNEKQPVEVKAIPKNLSQVEYHTIFYGRGKGIHSTTPFKGYMLKDFLAPYYPISTQNIKTGLFMVAGTDGYRVAITYSELFNRNDQSEFLLIDDASNSDGGRFALFPAGDFFSDRAVRAISLIHFEN